MTTQFTLTCPQAALLAAVQTALGAVERRNTIPVLGNLLLEPGAAGLAVSGTDLDVMTTVETGIACEPGGGVTLPAHLLNDILRKLPDGAEVTLTRAASGQMALSAGRSRFQLQALPPEDWPRMANPSAKTTRFEVPAARFAAMLASVSFAISTEETRYYLNGVYMHAAQGAGAGRLITVATDGHRLARAVLAGTEADETMPGVIIPSKTVGLVQKLLAGVGSDARLSVTVSESQIVFETGSVRIASKLIDGTFPDYSRVIPEDGANVWVFDAAALSSAVDRVSIVSSERGRAVKMDWGRDRLELQVVNPDAGSGQEDMEVEAGDGGDIEIGFNAKYLGQMLDHMTGRATVTMAGPGAPARFAPVHHEHEDIETTFVLMPMRV